jgi:hypothetical protein
MMSVRSYGEVVYNHTPERSPTATLANGLIITIIIMVRRKV